MVLGIIFFILLIALAIFYIVDPYNLKPLFFGSQSQAMISEAKPVIERSAGPESQSIETKEQQKFLTKEQKDAIDRAHINTNILPKEITPELLICFEDRLGTERVKEIQSGSVPSPLELLNARSCVD